MSAPPIPQQSGDLEFEEFVRRVDATVRDAATVGAFAPPANSRPGSQARWETRARNATVVLVPPRNVSVTLGGESGTPETTWYPVDAALVSVVSRRIAGYLGEA